MLELQFIHYGLFDYYLDGEDVTEEVVGYFNNFDVKNLLKLELEEFFDLVGVELQTIFIDMDNCEVYAKSFGTVDITD